MCLHQTQGNTWVKVINKIEHGQYTAEYLFVSRIWNDVDLENDLYYDKLYKSVVWIRLVECEYGPTMYYSSKHNLWFDDQIEKPKNFQNLNHKGYLDGRKENSRRLLTQYLFVCLFVWNLFILV